MNFADHFVFNGDAIAILDEVNDTSILRTELSTAMPPSRLVTGPWIHAPAAGWSAATSCHGGRAEQPLVRANVGLSG